MVELAISDRITDAAAVADAIGTISLCIAQTNINLNVEHRVYDVFKGLETLSRALSDVLCEISGELWNKELESNNAKQDLKTLSGTLSNTLSGICDELGNKDSKGGETV